MKILIIGKDISTCAEESQEQETETCTIVSSENEVLKELQNKTRDALVLIIDNKKSVFYSLLARLNEVEQPVQLLLLNPTNRYYLVADNDQGIAVNYHLPVKEE